MIELSQNVKKREVEHIIVMNKGKHWEVVEGETEIYMCKVEKN